MAKKYKHLTILERQALERYRAIGRSNGWIANQLGVSKSTIGRELKRNGDAVPGRHKSRSILERAQYRDLKAKNRKRASRLGKGKLDKDEVLRQEVKRLLEQEHWSPEDIEHRISDFSPEWKISGRAIRNFIKRRYPEWREHLYFKGKSRRSRIAGRLGMFGKTGIKKRSIHERPAEVNERKVYGHYEADTIHSCPGSAACVLTIRERKTRHIFTFILKDRTASTTIQVLLLFFQKLPAHMAQSLTVDNGPEFAEIWKLEKVIPGFKTYFCDPYKASQRGSNENGNGRVRRFWAKGTDFSTVSNSALEEKTKKINAKPMQLLNWRSPKEEFNKILQLAA